MWTFSLKWVMFRWPLKFVQFPLYLLRWTLPSFTFIKSFISFDSSFHKMFGHFLHPRSFDSLERLLAHKQASLPITFDGVGFISTSTITPIAYLGNWAFVVSIIVVRFMVDQCIFLLRALARIDNNTFHFQQQLKAACDLLPPPASACFPPFEQLFEQQMVQFQDSILECLHHHTLSSMLFDRTFEAHHARILSCCGPRVNIWFIIRPIFLNFRLFSLIFCTTFCTQLGLSHVSIAGIL